MPADIMFVVFVLYGFIFGLRRGFYKELIAFAALVIAFGAARTWRDPAGRILQSKLTFLGPGPATVLGAVVIWILAFFLVNVIGRLILKKIRNPDGENTLEQAAEGVADAAEGDTKNMGPVTLLTNPVAKAHKSVVYWSDKVLGGLLGVVKGAVGAYAVFGVVYFVDVHVYDLGRVQDSIAESRSAAFFRDYLIVALRQFPEFRVFENVRAMKRLAEETKGEPQVVERLALHPSWEGVKATQIFKDVAADPEVKAAWVKAGPDGKRDVKALLRNPKVRRLLQDQTFQDAFADTNVEEVIKAASAPPPPKQETPPAPKND